MKPTLFTYKGKAYTKNTGFSCECCEKDLSNCIKYDYIQGVMWKNYKRLAIMNCPIHPNTQNDECTQTIYFNNLPKEKFQEYYEFLYENNHLDHKKYKKSPCMLYNESFFKECFPSCKEILYEYARRFGISSQLFRVSEEMVCRFLKYHKYGKEVRKYIDEKNNTNIIWEILDIFKSAVDGFVGIITANSGTWFPYTFF